MDIKGFECYIVKVYRRGQGESKDFIGTVEEPGQKGVRVFKTREELLSIIDYKEPESKEKDKKD